MMAIRGLTDQGAAFPRIGSIRKGSEKRANGPGKDLDHFRFTSDDPLVQMAFTSVFGDEPKEIDFFLPYGTPDENFEAWREEWAAGGLKHRCDGEVMTVWLDGSKYVRGERPCPYAGKPEKERLCKQTGRLSIIIPDLRRLGYVTVHTSSTFDIVSLSKHLNALYFLLQMRGKDLRGIPMTLRRVEREISTPGPQGRLRRKASLLVIEPKPEWVAMSISQIDRQAMSESVALLDMPREESDEETVEVVAPVEPTAHSRQEPASAPPSFDQLSEPQKRQVLMAKWQKLWAESKSLGIIDLYHLPPMPANVSIDDFKECGKGMQALVVAYKNGDSPAASEIATTISEIIANYEEPSQEVPA